MHAERHVRVTPANPQPPTRTKSPYRRALGLTGLLAFGCYPLGFDSASELDTVLTWQNPETDFSRFRTYAIPDEVVDLCADEDGDLPGLGGAGTAGGPPLDIDDCEEADHRYDETIIAAVRANMAALGFEEVPLEDGEEPDVIVMPGIVASRVWFVYSSYPWWWYYGYDWYWGGYGPGWYTAYPQVTAVAYPMGTIVLDMLAIAEENEETKEVPSAWVGTIHGLIAPGTSPSSVRGRIEANIDQAFEQSPYLEREDP